MIKNELNDMTFVPANTDDIIYVAIQASNNQGLMFNFIS